MDQSSSLPLGRIGTNSSHNPTGHSVSPLVCHKQWRIWLLFAMVGMGSLMCYHEMLRIYAYTSVATVWIDEAVELVDVAHQIEESLQQHQHFDNTSHNKDDERSDDDAAIIVGDVDVVEATPTSWTDGNATDGGYTIISLPDDDAKAIANEAAMADMGEEDVEDDANQDETESTTSSLATRDDGTNKAQPALNVVELSIQHVEPPSNIRAAVCFKTLFGQIDLGIVIQWVAYNILLGFDRIFMFYRPEVTQLPRWNELSSLPYVTLIKQTKGSREDYYDQAGTELRCLRDKRLAATYDWVLTADIDEYLWFPRHIGVKEFLQRYSNATYLSFGKQMHSLTNRVDKAYLNHKIDVSDSSTFAVSHYPFYMKYFCRQKRRKNHPICPTWVGRAKVMVRPKHHNKIMVHGTIGHDRLDNRTKIHFHPDAAHFMEWPEIFARHNVTHRAPQRFTIRSQDEVSIHDVHTGFTRIGGDGGKFLVWDGEWQVEYDAHLKDWFDFVIGRGTTAADAPTND